MNAIINRIPKGSNKTVKPDRFSVGSSGFKQLVLIRVLAKTHSLSQSDRVDTEKMKKSEMGQDKSNKGSRFKRPESMASKNKMRMGGKGLSLEAFANAKSKTDYNPAIIKKKREFYKNAKHVNKYKKLKKHENFPNNASFPDIEPPKDEIEPVGGLEINQERKKKKKDSAWSLNEVYERKRKEQEKARNEKEAIIQAKKERKEQSQTQRKALREKMLKRTRSGQPVMKYRIEHMLEKIQGSKS